MVGGLTMGYNDNRSQPISMKVDRASNPVDKIIDYSYEYYDASGNNNNRIRRIVDSVDGAYTTDYLYDDYNRLANASWGTGFRYYQYDAWGNIKDFSALTLNYATNAYGAPATNRISSDGAGFNYSYDEAGNMTVGMGQSYAYDGANRMKTAGNGNSTYGYDGDGVRVRKTESGATAFYVRSSMLKNTAMEVNMTGVLRAYMYGNGRLIAMQATDGQFYWLHTNHLGSSQAMTDVNGNLTYKGQLDPYGQTLSEWSVSGNNNLNTKKFTGYERDTATGLDYAGARSFTSGRGRFMQPDPIGLKGATKELPQSLNRYSYVGNDPINHVDPTGLLTLIIGGAGDSAMDPDYGRPDSDFWKMLKEIFGEDPEVFMWSGSGVTAITGYAGIIKGGEDLAQLINNHTFKDGEKLNIVAHSHGGNVVKVAIGLLKSRTIDNLVTLGTPQNLDLNIYFNRSKAGNYCNVFDFGDLIQFAGASPLQIFLTVRYAYLSAVFEARALRALFLGDFRTFAYYEWQAARALAISATAYLSTKIDLSASNVDVSSSHPDLHTVKTWKDNNIKGRCGL